MNIVIDGIMVSLELLNAQRYRNMEVIPVSLNRNGHKDYLTLKRGISAGFVEISECEVSTVGTVLARNKSNVPLVLIDGDEIVGAKQNRIMNRSLIVPPLTTMEVSVSCTEQGRWHYDRTGYRTHFDYSDIAADFSTRRNKAEDLFENDSCQSTVWNSIHDLERKTSFKSRTSVLHDNFINLRSKLDEYLKHFHVEYGQRGAIFIINGEIKGLELFANPSIYHDYHEKIFRSYIMEAIVDYRSSCGCENFYGFLREISCSEFRPSRRERIGRHLHFANDCGYGAALFEGCTLVHLNYFSGGKSRTIRRKTGRRYGSFRDFVDDS